MRKSRRIQEFRDRKARERIGDRDPDPVFVDLTDVSLASEPSSDGTDTDSVSTQSEEKLIEDNADFESEEEDEQRLNPSKAIAVIAERGSKKLAAEDSENEGRTRSLGMAIRKEKNTENKASRNKGKEKLQETSKKSNKKRKLVNEPEASSNVISSKKKMKSLPLETPSVLIQDNLSSMKIVDGRAMHLSYIDQNFPIFEEWFKHQHLLKFIQIEEPIYPRLVKQFYSSMNVEEINGKVVRIKSVVNKVELVINSKVLAEVYETKNSGYSLYHTHSWIQLDGFDHDAVGRKLTGKSVDEELAPDYKPLGYDLTLEFKFLFSMIRNIFLPRLGTRENVSHFDIFFMWACITKKKLNFPFIMLQHLAGTRSRCKDKSLPYGMALTWLFQHFKVNLTRETDIRPVKYYHHYSDTILLCMDYKRDVNGVIRKKAEVDANGVWIKLTESGIPPPQSENEESLSTEAATTMDSDNTANSDNAENSDAFIETSHDDDQNLISAPPTLCAHSLDVEPPNTGPSVFETPSSSPVPPADMHYLVDKLRTEVKRLRDKQEEMTVMHAKELKKLTSNIEDAKDYWRLQMGEIKAVLNLKPTD